MTGKDNKKANILVTFRFPDNSSFTDDVDSEILVQAEIATVMHKLVKEGKISHFVVGNDDVISEKLSVRCSHNYVDMYEEKEENITDKILRMINHCKESGMGKKKSLEYLENFIEKEVEEWKS